MLMKSKHGNMDQIANQNSTERILQIMAYNMGLSLKVKKVTVRDNPLQQFTVGFQSSSTALVIPPPSMSLNPKASSFTSKQTNQQKRKNGPPLQMKTVQEAEISLLKQELIIARTKMLQLETENKDQVNTCQLSDLVSHLRCVLGFSY